MIDHLFHFTVDRKPVGVHIEHGHEHRQLNGFRVQELVFENFFQCNYGTVVALEEVFEDEFLHAKAIQLSVFMTVFNVHANWFPVDGKVEKVVYHPGRFRAAYLPKSSTENEHSSILIRAKSGEQILVRQIAGALARRIVTYAAAGDEADISTHLGFIKFGSRVDIFLPLDADIKVKIGDKTTGGITEIAYLKNKSN